MTALALEMIAVGLIFMVTAMIAQSPWPMMIWVIWYGCPDDLKYWAMSWLMFLLPKPHGLPSPTFEPQKADLGDNQVKITENQANQASDNQLEGVKQMQVGCQAIIEAWLSDGKPIHELSGRKIAAQLREENSAVNENAARWVAGELLKKHQSPTPFTNGVLAH